MFRVVNGNKSVHHGGKDINPQSIRECVWVSDWMSESECERVREKEAMISKSTAERERNI